MKSEQIFHLPVSLTIVKEPCAPGMNSCKAQTSSPDKGACHLFAVICQCENSQARACEIKFPLNRIKAGFGHLYLFTTLSCRLSNCFLLLLFALYLEGCNHHAEKMENGLRKVKQPQV